MRYILLQLSCLTVQTEHFEQHIFNLFQARFVLGLELKWYLGEMAKSLIHTARVPEQHLSHLLAVENPLYDDEQCNCDGPDQY